MGTGFQLGVQWNLDIREYNWHYDAIVFKPSRTDNSPDFAVGLFAKACDDSNGALEEETAREESRLQWNLILLR